MYRESIRFCQDRMLPFFQDLANLVDRCNSITVNIIHQLASLHHSMQKLWKSTFKHVHLIPVYHALGELLEVLITLDAIVVDNPAIASAWDQYKRMMQVGTAAFSLAPKLKNLHASVCPGGAVTLWH